MSDAVSLPAVSTMDPAIEAWAQYEFTAALLNAVARIPGAPSFATYEEERRNDLLLATPTSLDGILAAAAAACRSREIITDPAERADFLLVMMNNIAVAAVQLGAQLPPDAARYLAQCERARDPEAYDARMADFRAAIAAVSHQATETVL